MKSSALFTKSLFSLIIAPLFFALPVSAEIVQNQLKPFTSDGCSFFPDGIPGINKDKWLECCVKHDIAYWQGGTSEQRRVADKEIGQCVVDTNEGVIGQNMELGVRFGGAAVFPTSYRWGYGWVQNRGYKPLTQDEQQQVSDRIAEMKTSFLETAITPSNLLKPVQTMTGNVCMDQAIAYTQEMVGGKFNLMNTTDTRTETAAGFVRTLTLQVSECKKPLRFEFLLLRASACETVKDDLQARAQIRLQKTGQIVCEK